MVFNKSNKKLLMKLTGGLSTVVGTSSAILVSVNSGKSGDDNKPSEVNSPNNVNETSQKEDKKEGSTSVEKPIANNSPVSEPVVKNTKSSPGVTTSAKTNGITIRTSSPTPPRVVKKPKPKEDKFGISLCESDEVKKGKSPQICQLTAEQLKKIKFDKTNNGEISVAPLGWGKKLTLTIEYTDDSEHFPNNKKYIFTNKLKDENDKDVEISNIKGGKVVLKKNGAGVEFREKDGNKLERAPTEDKFGIPLSCQSYKVTEGKQPQTCQLTEEQLKKVKFEKEDKSSITITGLTENNKVNLTISDASTDTTNYPKGKKYSFTNKNNDPVTIKGTKDEDIILENGKEITFREKDDKLERIIEVDDLGIPRICKKSECDLNKKNMENIKFSGFTSGGTIVGGMDDGKKIRLKVEGSSYIFKGMDEQVILNNSGRRIEFKVGNYSYYSGSSGSLVKVKDENKFDILGIPKTCNFEGNNKECQLNVSDLKNIKFSIGDNETLNVSPERSNNKITLKIKSVAGEQEYTDGIRYIFKDIKEKITISGKGQDNEIVFNKERDDEVWFKKNKDGKLEKVRTVPKVDNLGIPFWCQFGRHENVELECELKVHYLEKIKFSIRKDKDLKATITKGNPTIKLTRKRINAGTQEDPHKLIFGNSMKYTFEVKGGNIKVSNGGEEEIHFKNETNLEFKKENNKLKRAWDAEKLGKKINLDCDGEKECIRMGDKSINVLYEKVTYEGDMKKGFFNSSKKFKYYEDQEGYNQGFKFVPEEDIPLNKGSKKLAKGVPCEIKYDYFPNNNWYISKVNG